MGNLQEDFHNLSCDKHEDTFIKPFNKYLYLVYVTN